MTTIKKYLKRFKDAKFLLACIFGLLRAKRNVISIEKKKFFFFAVGISKELAMPSEMLELAKICFLLTEK